MITLVAPLARTAAVRLTMPAAVYCDTKLTPPVTVQPLAQQLHDTSCGSLYRSKMTPLSPLNAFATDVHMVGAWSASGMGRMVAACVVPGPPNWLSRITYNPCA